MKGKRADQKRPSGARHTSYKRSGVFANSKSRTKYPPNIKSVIRSLLDRSPLPRDALPYTDEFKRLKKSFEGSQKTTIKDVDFWRMLSSVGKGGGLAGKAETKRAPRTSRLTEDQQLEILRLSPDGIGNRDDLPYTAKFDEMHRRFAKLTGTQLTKHEFWRGLSRVAKLSRKPRPVYETAPLGGLGPDLVHYLEQNNPWWRAEQAKRVPSFRRWAFAEVVNRLTTKLAPIVAVRGSRRVGKSVIQDQLIEELLLVGRPDPTAKPVDPRRILRVVFEDAPSLGGMVQPIQAIVRWYEEQILRKSLNASANSGEPAYLFFDEVQNLPKWSVQLKILADNSDARILVTGSSALRIAKGQDNLAGRMTTIELGPLRLTEVAGIRRLGQLPAYAPDTALEEWKKRDFWIGLVAHGKKNTSIRDQAFRLYSEFGG